jgi:hypothetical protein
MGDDHSYPPSRWFYVREKYLHDRYRSLGRSLREGRKVMNQSLGQQEASSVQAFKAATFRQTYRTSDSSDGRSNSPWELI